MTQDEPTTRLPDLVFHHHDPLRSGIEREQDPPCSKLDYCPYGYMVEFFPVEGMVGVPRYAGVVFRWLRRQMKSNEFYCPVFAHSCPAYFVAEKIPIERLEVPGE